MLGIHNVGMYLDYGENCLTVASQISKFGKRGEIETFEHIARLEAGELKFVNP